ncbi:MAG: ABC transporter substrate-binding protein [Actinomycetota bacterium]
MRRRTLAAVLVGVALIAAACTSNDGSGSSSGSGSGSGSGAPVSITLWHGYGKVESNNGQVNHEALSLQNQIDAFNASHPDIYVEDVFCCSNDSALEKLTVALNGDLQPDITYQYGTSMAQIATAPGVMDLAPLTQDQTYDWNDFFEGVRAAGTIDGKVLGVPAQVGNLAVIYNADLFAAAGLDVPGPDWTWDDFVAAAKAISDPATKTFGVAFPADGSEDTVWHFDAMLWEAGGDILTQDNTHAAFNSPAGAQALTTLQQMAVADQSMFVDQANAKIDALFNAGSVGMVISGPWAVSGYKDVNYGVQVMPAYASGSHQTISGQDFWVAFDNGPERAAATQTFLAWLTSPEQIQQDSMETGHLPTRSSVVTDQFVKDFNTKFPGEGLFAENLQNVQKARPALTSYDQVSRIVGQAIVSVLLGQAEPQQALDDAAADVDQALAGG